jgi:acyl-CoA synthetase (AMP-forming)/AMP-acid ligase II
VLSLLHVLEWRAAVHPEAVALTDQQGAQLTYAGLAAATERSAAGFAAAGVAPGDVVPIIARNQVGWVTAMLGLIRVGSRAEPPDLSQLTEIVYGASPIRPDVLERAVAVVITGGENVFPAEVEAVLARHPAVADVAVIGIPDERWGEAVHAVVVAAPGFEAPGSDGFDTAGLVGWARERLAGYKCPTGVTLVPELPRNATGKVLRATLREPFWAGRDRLVS